GLLPPSSALGGGGSGLSTAFFASAPASSVSGSNDHVLLDKVSRALRVRTDNPAMSTALDALAGLSLPTASFASPPLLARTGPREDDPEEER
ncbi:hypothetical protein ACHAWF_000349, partial [Thalassiosira exigua]